MKPITEQENYEAQKTHDDYWSQYSHKHGEPSRKIRDLGITDEQYRVACKTLYRYQAQESIKRSHALAHYLLSLPDMPVIGEQVGQGSNEMGDDTLHGFDAVEYSGENVIKLTFGDGPLTGNWR